MKRFRKKKNFSLNVNNSFRFIFFFLKYTKHINKYNTNAIKNILKNKNYKMKLQGLPNFLDILFKRFNKSKAAYILNKSNILN